MAEDNNKTLEKRIVDTLKIAESRGYNLTLEKLSENLVGGKKTKKEIFDAIKENKFFEFDGKFISTIGNLKSDKCKKRFQTNNDLQIQYLTIAQKFTSEFIKFCPFIKCIMISGSMASDGLCKDDDIDLNIVVDNGSKYTSWLLGILLSLKYSMKYRKEFNVKWFNSIARVICISVIWEKHQVIPFARKDLQIAYELFLNKKVLYNKKFYKQILFENQWLNEWFPQIYDEDEDTGIEIEKKIINNKKPNRIIEFFSKTFIFLLYYWIEATIFWHDELINRMHYVNNAKYPYAILDIPKKE